MKQQGEIDRRCMIAVVEQAFGYVHRGHTSTLVLQTVEHKLMFTDGINGQFIDILQTFLDIVGIERSQWSHHLDILATECEDIGKSAQFYSEVTMIGRHLWEELFQPLSHAHRTSTRTSTAMRCREGLMQVDMHHVEAHITRAAGT